MKDSGGRSFVNSTFRLYAFIAFIVLLVETDHVASLDCAPERLELVVGLHRHGDRLPVFKFPFDPYPNLASTGALTPEGVNQLCNLGYTIKFRYGSLLQADGQYSAANTQYMSSSSQRCIDSARALLNCLTAQYRNQWVAAPHNVQIRSIPASQDDLLLQSKTCPKYDKQLGELVKDTQKSSRVHKFNQKYMRLFEDMSRASGKRIDNLFAASKILDTLKVYKLRGMPLARHWNKIYEGKGNLMGRANRARTEYGYMRRVKGGRIATDIFDHLKNHQQGQKIRLYSAHETTLVSISNAFRWIKQTGSEPGYGAALIFELYEGNRSCDDKIVKVVYFQDSNVKTPKEIEIPECPNPCKLEKLHKMMKDNKVYIKADEYVEECK